MRSCGDGPRCRRAGTPTTAGSLPTRCWPPRPPSRSTTGGQGGVGWGVGGRGAGLQGALTCSRQSALGAQCMAGGAQAAAGAPGISKQRSGAACCLVLQLACPCAP